MQVLQRLGGLTGLPGPCCQPPRNQGAVFYRERSRLTFLIVAVIRLEREVVSAYLGLYRGPGHRGTQHTLRLAQALLAPLGRLNCPAPIAVLVLDAHHAVEAHLIEQGQPASPVDAPMPRQPVGPPAPAKVLDLLQPLGRDLRVFGMRQESGPPLPL